MALELNSIGKSFNFEVYEPSILGGMRRNVKLLAILDFNTAMTIKGDLHATHKRIYNFIKANGVIDDPRSYLYCKFVDAQGAISVLGMPWINQNTMVETVSTGMYITIPNMGHESISKVSALLQSGGVTGFKIEIK